VWTLSDSPSLAVGAARPLDRVRGKPKAKVVMPSLGWLQIALPRTSPSPEGSGGGSKEAHPG
jgi:hypothetical protein